MTLSLPHHRLVIAAAFGAALLAAPAAQAFTIENAGEASGGSAFNAPDPSNPQSRFGTVGTSNGPVIRQGNTTVQFGGTQQRGNFHQRFNSDRLFDPIARDR